MGLRLWELQQRIPNLPNAEARSLLPLTQRIQLYSLNLNLKLNPKPYHGVLKALKVFGVYLKPRSMQNDSPKPLIIAIKAIVLHTCGVQVEVNLAPRGWSWTKTRMASGVSSSLAASDEL